MITYREACEALNAAREGYWDNLQLQKFGSTIISSDWNTIRAIIQGVYLIGVGFEIGPTLGASRRYGDWEISRRLSPISVYRTRGGDLNDMIRQAWDRYARQYRPTGL